MKIVRIEAFGGPEALHLAEVQESAPGPGQVAVRVEAAGVNFIDVYHRTGLYPNPLPYTPGLEGAGVVTAVGHLGEAQRLGSPERLDANDLH